MVIGAFIVLVLLVVQDVSDVVPEKNDLVLEDLGEIETQEKDKPHNF
jgi:hypothetical protein